MKNFLKASVVIFLLNSCNSTIYKAALCNIQLVNETNLKKRIITTGVWGTVSSKEGNCMPSTTPTNCTQCAVQRTVRVYAYTKASQAVASTKQEGGFYSSFNTQLIQELKTDGNGFYQLELPAGKYSVAVIENGELYVTDSDSDGGLGPVTISNGRAQKDLVLTYKAAF